VARSTTSSRTAAPASRRAAPVLAVFALVALALFPNASARADGPGRSLPIAQAVQTPNPVSGREADGRLSPAALHRPVAIDRLTIPYATPPAGVAIGVLVVLALAASVAGRPVARRLRHISLGRAPPALAATS
jgi:hypothetical protein